MELNMIRLKRDVFGADNNGEKLASEYNLDLSVLAPRELLVLERRYGLTTKTYEEIGLEYGVTRERIRQVCFKMLRKLRHPDRRIRKESES